MPDYVLNRDFNLGSTLGHRIVFKKGQPTFVPPIIEREAVAIGAVRADGNDVQIAMQIPEGAGQLSDAEMREQMVAAFDLIMERNDPKDFTAAGVPTVKAVERITEFAVDRQTVSEAWAEYKLSKVESN